MNNQSLNISAAEPPDWSILADVRRLYPHYEPTTPTYEFLAGAAAIRIRIWFG